MLLVWCFNISLGVCLTWAKRYLNKQHTGKSLTNGGGTEVLNVQNAVISWELRLCLFVCLFVCLWNKTLGDILPHFLVQHLSAWQKLYVQFPTLSIRVVIWNLKKPQSQTSLSLPWACQSSAPSCLPFLFRCLPTDKLSFLYCYSTYSATCSVEAHTPIIIILIVRLLLSTDQIYFA